MVSNIDMPVEIERAYKTLISQMEKLARMKHPQIIALILRKKRIGERALRNVFRESGDPRLVFLPVSALKRHDVTSLKEFLLSEARKVSASSHIDANLDFWETLRSAIRLMGGDKILWLDFTDTPLLNWPVWRCAIESGICSLILVCTEAQWQTATKDINEITDCVIDKTKLSSFLSKDDLPHIHNVASLYVNRKLDDKQKSKLLARVKSRDLEEITESEFVNMIWNILSEGETA